MIRTHCELCAVRTDLAQEKQFPFLCVLPYSDRSLDSERIHLSTLSPVVKPVGDLGTRMFKTEIKSRNQGNTCPLSKNKNQHHGVPPMHVTLTKVCYVYCMAIGSLSTNILLPLLGSQSPSQSPSPHYLLASQSLLEKHSQGTESWNVSQVLSLVFPGGS